MDVLDLIGLLAVGLVVWIWLDSLKARETAVAAVKAACLSETLLLLDDTVSIKRIGLGRTRDGVLSLRRVYGFEYSDTGDDRTAGTVSLVGNRVLVIELNLRLKPTLATLH